MKLLLRLGALITFLALTSLSSAQTSVNLSQIESPVLADVTPLEIPASDLLMQAPVAPSAAQPAPSQAPPTNIEADSVAQYRSVVKGLHSHKHLYVHCKLKTGKILTGQITDAGFEAFSVKTNILGEHRYVRYDDLAEAPRPVHAVGTRFKHAAQWVGVGVLVAVAVPVLLVLSPLLYFSGAWQC